MNARTKRRWSGTLKLVLAIDGSGVGALSAVALARALQGRSSVHDRRGLSVTAAIGIAGFGLAAAAVRLATRNSAPPHVQQHAVRVARRLLFAGFSINTAGCAAVLIAFRRSQITVNMAVALLIAGNLLSAIYARQLSAHRTRPRHAFRSARTVKTGTDTEHLRVSVVIPVKDDAAALSRCLNALARQSRAPDEVIVVDNASTDTTADVARDAGARVVLQLLPGIPAASTAGYDAARYDIIGRLDADSVPPPDWIEKGLRRLETDATIDALTGPGVFYDGPRHGSRLIAALYLGGYFTSLRLALGETPLFGSNFFLRRAAWQTASQTVHRSGLSLHDDIDLSIHLTPQHRIHYDRRIAVGISFRPFVQPNTGWLRMRRGLWTLIVNWPRSSSTLRWRRKLLHAIH